MGIGISNSAATLNALRTPGAVPAGLGGVQRSSSTNREGSFRSRAPQRAAAQSAGLAAARGLRFDGGGNAAGTRAQTRQRIGNAR